ncbi:4-alpha-glucanotransferase [Lachnospiraceae bacterium KM106-2]|nr:4-alpha-glucanotransferase [Lachnospiraceae bacterium KM106-2]
MRNAGILMSISALPSNYGVGDFGKSSYEFVDMISEANMNIWQLLPLNPLGYGNSPYQPYSSYAGDELYISLDRLVEDGLLSKELLKTEEVRSYVAEMKRAKQVDYPRVREFKNHLLKEAFKNFKPTKDYDKFVANEWVHVYGVFIALKKQNDLVCWNEWPQEQKDWIKDKKYDISHLEEEIQYNMFLQYEFYKQWMELKHYANRKGIKIMGDMPFYVGIDSQDVWENQDSFLLDKEGRPTYIAGVPPDYFSETGQRWGNPIYDWDYLKKTNYDFWIKRLDYSNQLYDIIRIDHFRAFDTYWKIPSTCPTAIEGDWIEAPGYELFDTLYEKIPKIKIVVEDLGDLRDEVGELRDHYKFKGMKVLQFTFDPKETNNNFPDRANMIVYTGTHDNQTIRGWYRSQKVSLQRSIRRKLKEDGYTHKDVSWNFIEMAYNSVANMAIVPMQDFLNLDDSGRINVPGTLGSPNWEWKLDSFSKFKKKLPEITELIYSAKHKRASK